MNYKLINQQPAGIFDITPLVESISWGGDIRQAARKMDISLIHSRDDNQPKYIPPLATWLMLKNDEREILRTVPFSTAVDTSGTLKVTSYTHAIYMLKSRHTAKFKSMTADAIIRQLCKAFGINVGTIPSTGVTLDKLILRNQTIWDMCVIALTETTERNGKKYQIRFDQGKLNVIEKAQQTVRWLITQGSNLMNASYSESIEDMRNRIVVVGDKDKVLARVEDVDLIRQYGLLQELKQQNDIKSGEARNIAKNVLKELGRVFREANIECLGLDDVEAGTAVEVEEKLTGLTGTFYVDTDEHVWQNGHHTMRLKLNWTDEVATKEAPQDNEQAE
jgi:hypothetical protein